MLTEAAPKQSYGMVSWFYFLLTTLTSLGFLCTQLVVNAVRNKTLLTESLDSLFSPGVYWNFVTANIALLAASGVLLGLTIAVIVVRALLHYKCCKGYYIVLGIQIIPWVYFAISCTNS